MSEHQRSSSSESFRNRAGVFVEVNDVPGNKNGVSEHVKGVLESAGIDVERIDTRYLENME